MKSAALSTKAKLFRGLADPSRLAVLEALRDGPRCVSAVVAAPRLSQPKAAGPRGGGPPVRAGPDRRGPDPRGHRGPGDDRAPGPSPRRGAPGLRPDPA